MAFARILGALLALALLVAGAAAQEAPERLRVGTRVAPPFAMKTQAGEWEGISIDLWRLVAARLGVGYALHETSLAGMVDEVAAGRLDLSVAAMTITPAREARVDFSHAFFHTGLGIATADRPWAGLVATLGALTSPEFLTTLALLSGLLFVVGALAWLAERRRNPRQFEPEARRGLGSGIWWAAVTMTTVGYGDKTPITGAGRLLAMVWMFAALLLTAVFTAQLAAQITVARVAPHVVAVRDLARLRVGIVTDSASLAPVRGLGARPVGYASVAAGYAALTAGEIDAFVHDRPILIWEAASRPEIGVTDLQFAPADYAIVLPQGSPLRERVNRELLAVLSGPDWQVIVARYLGDDPAAPAP